MEPAVHAKAEKDMRHKTAPPRLLRCSRSLTSSKIEPDLESKQCDDEKSHISQSEQQTDEIEQCTEENVNHSAYPRWILMNSLIVIVAALIYYSYFAVFLNYTHTETSTKSFDTSLRNLHVLLPDQPRETLRNVRAAVNLMRSDSEHHKVSVVLLASTQSITSDKSAVCVAQALAKALSGGKKKASVLDARKQTSLAQKIERELRQNHILVLRHIEQLSVPWILYRFCDAESPSVPNRIFLLTCAFGQNVDGTEGQRKLQDFLRQMWTSVNETSPSPFGAEQVDPLFSRIANNIVFVGRNIQQC